MWTVYDVLAILAGSATLNCVGPRPSVSALRTGWRLSKKDELERNRPLQCEDIRRMKGF